jgi:hypothetical protein
MRRRHVGTGLKTARTLSLKVPQSVKTARDSGLTIPTKLLLRADGVIE